MYNYTVMRKTKRRKRIYDIRYPNQYRQCTVIPSKKQNLIHIQFLVFLICIDLASLENIKNENLFQLFTFDNIFDWDFFHVFKEYDRLSKNYKDAVTRFLHAANICNQNDSRKNNN